MQDTPLAEAEDGDVLEWAARENRLMLTHDVGTMTAAAWKRVREGLPMPGLIEVGSDHPIGRAIEELHLIVLASRPTEHEAQVLFLPL